MLSGRLRLTAVAAAGQPDEQRAVLRFRLLEGVGRVGVPGDLPPDEVAGGGTDRGGLAEQLGEFGRRLPWRTPFESSESTVAFPLVAPAVAGITEAVFWWVASAPATTFAQKGAELVGTCST